MASQLSDAARAFLSAVRFGVLGVNRPDGPPHQSVMWYELQGDEIMMNTLVGRLKDGYLRRDARVSLCVEEGYDYVTVVGTVRLVEDQATAQADIARLARRYDDEEKAAAGIRRFQTQERVTLRMAIEQVTEHFD